MSLLYVVCLIIMIVIDHGNPCYLYLSIALFPLGIIYSRPLKSSLVTLKGAKYEMLQLRPGIFNAPFRGFWKYSGRTRIAAVPLIWEHIICITMSNSTQGRSIVFRDQSK